MQNFIKELFLFIPGFFAFLIFFLYVLKSYTRYQQTGNKKKLISFFGSKIKKIGSMLKLLFFKDSATKAFTVITFIGLLLLAFFIVYVRVTYHLNILWEYDNELGVKIFLTSIAMILVGIGCILVNYISDFFNIFNGRYMYTCCISLLTFLFFLYPSHESKYYGSLLIFFIFMDSLSYIMMLISIVQNNDLIKSDCGRTNLNLYSKLFILSFFSLIGTISYSMLTYLIIYFPEEVNPLQIRELLINSMFTLIPNGTPPALSIKFQGGQKIILELLKCIYKLIFTTTFVSFIFNLNFRDLLLPPKNNQKTAEKE